MIRLAEYLRRRLAVEPERGEKAGDQPWRFSRWCWPAAVCLGLAPTPLLAPSAGQSQVGASHAADELAVVRVEVREKGTGQPLPCRLTVTDPAGALLKVDAARVPGTAIRPGVIYTASGRAEFRVPAGRCVIHATRGMEYGLARRALRLRGGLTMVRLDLAREVDTAGYVSCDPHIHTLTHSGHGDATLQERMATIAGEGIELAIATDHNHHTDYAPTAKSEGAAGHFTPVIGNEVTTRVGHFNAFPIRPGAAIPDYRSTDWRELLAGMRAVPGVRVIMLNHPSNDHNGFIPTDPVRFHPASGESREGRPWNIDGMEVVTSAALQSDWMKPYRDWFALLNQGLSISGMGSSDTHDVNRFILGQGRTYLASTAEQPDRIDPDAACDSILAGKVLVSMGLFLEAWVDGRGPGETASPPPGPLRVRVRLQGPRWVAADRLDFYLNGSRTSSLPLRPRPGAVVKLSETIKLPRPPHDAWLVVIASGPGVREAYWPIPRPYQPDRPDWDPHVIGSTNPIRLDLDGDGQYRSPREQARQRLAAAGPDPTRITAALAGLDEAGVVQAVSLLRERGTDPETPALRRAFEAMEGPVRHGYVAYVRLWQQGTRRLSP